MDVRPLPHLRDRVGFGIDVGRRVIYHTVFLILCVGTFVLVAWFANQVNASFLITMGSGLAFILVPYIFFSRREIALAVDAGRWSRPVFRDGEYLWECRDMDGVLLGMLTAGEAAVRGWDGERVYLFDPWDEDREEFLYTEDDLCVYIEFEGLVWVQQFDSEGVFISARLVPNGPDPPK